MSLSTIWTLNSIWTLIWITNNTHIKNSLHNNRWCRPALSNRRWNVQCCCCRWCTRQWCWWRGRGGGGGHIPGGRLHSGLKEVPTCKKGIRGELKRRRPFYMIPFYFVFLDKWNFWMFLGFFFQYNLKKIFFFHFYIEVSDCARARSREKLNRSLLFCIASISCIHTFWWALGVCAPFVFVFRFDYFSN
jgi:hypothetical protein